MEVSDAGRAAIAQIAETKKALKKLCSLENSGYWDFKKSKFNQLSKKIDFVVEKVNEYKLDESIAKDVIKDVYETLLEKNENQVAEMIACEYITKKITRKSVKPLSIIGSIIATLFFGFLFLVLIINLNIPGGNWIIYLLLSFGYCLIHPYVGFIFYYITLWLFRSIDKAFNIKEKFSWKKFLSKRKLLFCSTWPILSPIFIVVSAIGVIFGNIYGHLFNKK